MRDKKLHDELPPAGNNPNVQSSKGDFNPPAPSTGTPDEKREPVSQNNPEAWHPDAKGAGDVRHTSYPQNEAAQNPAAWENASPHGDRSLSCARGLRLERVRLRTKKRFSGTCGRTHARPTGKTSSLQQSWRAPGARSTSARPKPQPRNTPAQAAMVHCGSFLQFYWMSEPCLRIRVAVPQCC